MTIRQTIQKAEAMALAGEALSTETIIRLLEIDPNSEEAELLGAAARQVAAKVTGNKAGIWASIGVDYVPCPMNCRFCSFGEAWGTAEDAYTLTDDEVVSQAKSFIESGADWITLRTTEHYEFSNLIKLARRIHAEIPGNYKLVANTGEMNEFRTDELKKGGFSILYHAIRLREGSDTPFSIAERRKTLEKIRGSELDLAFLVEPVGVEHTNREIADVFEMAMEADARIFGAMARIPVKGTPLYELGLLDERRLAQIVAVTRLAAGFRAPDICVHPASKTALKWGANVVVVDIGAVPRAVGVSPTEWNGFDIPTAKTWFKEAGYQQGVERSIPTKGGIL